MTSEKWKFSIYTELSSERKKVKVFLKLSAFSHEILQYNLKVSGITEGDKCGKALCIVPGGPNPTPASQELFLFVVYFQRIFWKQANLKFPNLAMRRWTD